MSDSNRIIPFTEFLKRTELCLQALDGSHEPITVTKHGRAFFVVQLIEVYRQIRAHAEHDKQQMLFDRMIDDIKDSEDYRPK